MRGSDGMVDCRYHDTASCGAGRRMALAHWFRISTWCGLLSQSSDVSRRLSFRAGIGNGMAPVGELVASRGGGACLYVGGGAPDNPAVEGQRAAHLFGHG